MNKHSVLIADAQYLSKLGLTSILQEHPEYKLSGCVSNQDNLESKVSNDKVDLVILDYNQEGAFSIDTVSMIKEKSPNTFILAISNDDNHQQIYDTIERGVTSYITKQCGEEEVHKAIEQTLKGEKFFCGKVLDVILAKSFGKSEEKKIQDILTNREIEILKLIAEGKVAKEISDELFISVHTIYTHRKNIMKKLKLSSPVELIMYAMNNGLVSI